jgi:hypothetical protein
MAFSDARNERDRAETGRNSTNHGGGTGGFGGRSASGARGTLSQQQDQRNLANARSRGNIAPGVGMGSATDARARNSRYNQNLIASGPLTAHNMWEAFKSLPTSGVGAVSTMLGALGVPGLGPQYEGVTPRSATGYSYDGPNRFAVNGSNSAMQGGIRPIQAAGAPGAAGQSPQMAWQSMQPAMLGGPVPGLQNYSVNTPGYNYLGSVGKPQQPAMFGMPRRG